MDDKMFTVIDEDGNELLCEILFTFHSDDHNKDYVVYTIPGQSDEEETEVSAAIYTETADGEGDLLPIETDEEWELVEQVLEDFADEENDDVEA